MAELWGILFEFLPLADRHCKAGGRLLKALNFLRQHGFKYLKSVEGGIGAWSEEIDSNVPRY